MRYEKRPCFGAPAFIKPRHFRSAHPGKVLQNGHVANLQRRNKAMQDKFTRNTIQEILRDSGLDSVKAQQATIRIIEALVDSLAAGESVELRGLGSLEVRERKAYKARNPKTGEAVITQARRRVLFRPGRKLKAALSSTYN